VLYDVRLHAMCVLVCYPYVLAGRIVCYKSKRMEDMILQIKSTVGGMHVHVISRCATVCIEAIAIH